MFKLLDSIEQPALNEEKLPRNYTEDVPLFTPYLVAVADGITPRSLDDRWLVDYSSDAEWIAHTFIESLKVVAQKREKSGLNDAHEIIKQAITKTIDEFLPLKAVSKVDKPACCVSIVLQHIDDKSKFTFVNIGSNSIFYNDKVISHSPIIESLYKEIEEEIAEKTSRGGIVKERKTINSLRQRTFHTNTEKGYPAVDLSFDCLSHPQTVIETITLEKGDKIMIATEGLTRCIRLYKKYKESNFLANCLEKGLATILEEVREVEKNDWGRVRYPRYVQAMDVCASIYEIE